MNDWKNATFEDFIDTLKGHNNINVVPLEGGYPERRDFLVALCEKANITTLKIHAPDRVQAYTREKNGKIYIESLDEGKNPSFTTWTISSDFSVTQGTRAYHRPKLPGPH